ncbi:hypothetical protein FNV43_RR22047 [Rhamnella rubrinervis]|uniref:Protein kinase domain-containing protein n=1 Tax=Rhamnella rubrinervis TaxID=2594499 RepID=A0A8K0DPR1_9ROSA|nr:hypothetical protein FNV43_RR22047 [Rhamnella rubrinervis]
MRSHFVVVAFLVLLCTASVEPQGDAERNALLYLKAAFNNDFLNNNWTGIHCNATAPSNWLGIHCLLGRVTAIVLEDAGLTSGQIGEDVFNSFTELSVLSLKGNSMTSTMMSFSFNPKLTQIDLSRNTFHGEISQSLLGLPLLKSLHLQDNGFTGPIPELNQSSLTSFNVSNNILSVVIVLLFLGYRKKMKRLKDMMREHDYQDRSRDDIVDQKHDDDDDHQNISIEEGDQIMRRSSSTTTTTRSVVAAGGRGGVERRKLIFVGNNELDVGFGMGDLLKASAEGLGNGISGNSYKAMMEGKPAVVVKRLRDLKPLSTEEFKRQLMLMADLTHPNLLPLLAYYYSRDEKLLIFRYARKGNLFNRLHEDRGSRDRIPFRWSSRLSVARGVARALEYLHLHATLPAGAAAPHGNLKCSNILLEDNDTVLVSDYGLASLIAFPIASQGMVSYKSPEYQIAKRVSKKSDVWKLKLQNILVEDKLSQQLHVLQLSPSSETGYAEIELGKQKLKPSARHFVIISAVCSSVGIPCRPTMLQKEYDRQRSSMYMIALCLSRTRLAM